MCICINNVFSHPADPYSDMILADGISVLCNDLEVFLSSLNNAKSDVVYRT